MYDLFHREEKLYYDPLLLYSINHTLDNQKYTHCWIIEGIYEKITPCSSNTTIIISRKEVEVWTNSLWYEEMLWIAISIREDKNWNWRISLLRGEHLQYKEKRF